MKFIAINHVVSKTNKLDMKLKYNGDEQLQVSSGECFNISHIKNILVSTLPFHHIFLVSTFILRIFYEYKGLQRMNLAYHNSQKNMISLLSLISKIVL